MAATEVDHVQRIADGGSPFDHEEAYKVVDPDDMELPAQNQIEYHDNTLTGSPPASESFEGETDGEE